MFLRKLIVILVPLLLLSVVCLALPLLRSLDAFLGPLLYGALLGLGLSLLLPLSGATRLREPFAFLLWVPAALILLLLVGQYLVYTGVKLPLLTVPDFRIIAAESAFMCYMLCFSIRTGKGI